ncbi:hypothetical protein I4U23_010963 [Adineta vaga]|nr:hypothetical protein I4U23_010963 [Adineta vaga]
MQCDDIASVNTEVLRNAYSDRQKLRSFEQRMKERMRANLPIFNSRTEFCRRLKTERVLIVRAETGSGKSTQLPQYATEYFRDGLIVCTQPSAVATMLLARRVANEYDGESEGHYDGFIPKDCVALPLYGSMSLEEQDKVLNFDDENEKRRMVVFCTNVAETSLTINNVRLVIDSGLAKEARFDIKRRLTVIETIQISHSSAQQRKGRAGRTISDGHCIRLYNKNDFKREHIEPEILRSLLDLTILQILRLGLDSKTFPFLDQPDLNLITNTFDLLTRLSCIDGNKTLTIRGQLFSELSLDPCFSASMAKAYTAPNSLFYIGGITKETKDEARALVALSVHQYDSDFVSFM